MTTPLVLGSFVVNNKRNGITMKYRIQTVTKDLVEDVLFHMNRYFLVREPLCADSDIIGEPESLSSINTFWRRCCTDTGVAIVALLEEDGKPPKVIGANMTYLYSDGNKIENLPGEAYKRVENLEIDDKVHTRIFEIYGVTNYLSAFGLSVNPKYSGFKIGENLLKCREPLCKYLGMKVTTSLFTSLSGQTCAARAGFKTLFEISFKAHADNGEDFFPNLTGKSLKIMVKHYDIQINV